MLRSGPVDTVAFRADYHGDHHGDQRGDGGGNADRAQLGAAVSGLATALNGVALVALAPIRPGTAKRTGSTPIVSHSVRPSAAKPAPRLLGVQSGVAGVNIAQNGALAVGVAGTTTISQNGPLTIGPGEEWTASAVCPTGLATGGGESNTSSAGVVLNQSYAYGDGSGWIVEVRNQSAQSATYTVYAVCTTGLTNYQTVNSDIPLNPGQSGQANASCPEGTNAVGTGIQAGLNAGIRWYTITNRQDGPLGGAVVRVSNVDTRIGEFAAQAICSNGTPLGDGTGSSGQDLPPNGYLKATVEAPFSGEAVISGGGGVDPAGSAYLTDSYPDTGADGNAAWSVWVRNTSNVDEWANANHAPTMHNSGP